MTWGSVYYKTDINEVFLTLLVAILAVFQCISWHVCRFYSMHALQVFWSVSFVFVLARSLSYRFECGCGTYIRYSSYVVWVSVAHMCDGNQRHQGAHTLVVIDSNTYI